MTRVLVLGATSGIAKSVAAIYGRRGARLFLVGRNGVQMAGITQALADGGASDVRSALADLSKPELQGDVIDEAWTAFGGFDRVLIAYGVLPDESASPKDWRLATEAMQTNLVSVVTLLDRVVERADSERPIHIGVIGSVAGDRGRARVAIYAAAKSGVERYVEALQQRCNQSKIRITLIKPGWVRTPMIAHMPPSALIASADHVAVTIVRALDGGAVRVYVPAWWRVVMAFVRAIPGPLFRRLRF